MGFFGRLFGKKEDDYSDMNFDSSLPPFSADATLQGNPSMTQGSSNVASFMQQAGDDFTGLPPFDTTNNQPASASYPQTQHSLPTPPSSASLSGQQLAHHYMQREQQPSASNQPMQRTAEHSLELINVKLDAIRSELAVIGQRIDKLEQKKW